MTDEEKAEELTTELICGKCKEIKHCKIIGNDKCINYIRSLNAILQGYKKGLVEGRKEGYEQGKNNERELQCGKKNYEKDIAILQKENEELNLNKTELTNSVTELKTKITELENQLKNNPYVQILQKEKAELAEDFAKQIEKMKCCGNCGNDKCTSKYRGNSAYHRQENGFACADNEDWKPRKRELAE